MFEFLNRLDRRWIFFTMFLAVSIPILAGLSYPEKPSPMTRLAFAEFEKLQPGDRVMISFDFDPASSGEIAPMGTAFMYHAAKRGAKIYLTALWPVGPSIAEETIAKVLNTHFPHMKYGEDYVHLGYKSGNEGVIKVIITDLKKLYNTDQKGTSIESIPMMQSIQSVQDMDMVVSVSAGYAGAKEWVQYAKTSYPDAFTMIAGCTGVQAAPLLPYVPNQLPGLVAAIKGAAEYETLLAEKYGTGDIPQLNEARRRMGPQLWAHVLMVILILLGNLIFFAGKSREKLA